MVAALSGSRLLSIVGWIYSWCPQLFNTAMPGVSEPPHYLGRTWHMALFSVDTRMGSCRWGGEDGYWFLTKHPCGSLFHQSQLMFRGPSAWEPAWCYSFITTPSRSAHRTTRAHMLLCSEIARGRRQTFRAHDEVVNVWPCGHARAHTALFNYPPRGHHLYVDNLGKKEKKKALLAGKQYIYFCRFTNSNTCVSCINVGNVSSAFSM